MSEEAVPKEHTKLEYKMVVYKLRIDVSYQPVDLSFFLKIDVLRITKQNKTFETIVTHEVYVFDSGYNVFKVMTDMNGTMILLVIQPENDKDPSAYIRCVTHFLKADDSPYFEQFPNSYISITYHANVEGDDRKFMQPIDDVGFE